MKIAGGLFLLSTFHFHSFTAIISKAMVVFPMMLCFLFPTLFALPQPSTQLFCNETERDALLNFKHALYDPGHRLSSWSIQRHHDCCQWDGVYCHNITGRVLKLDLHNPCLDSDTTSCEEFKLGGKVSSALLRLEFLNYLDLSYNDFGGIPIPSFLGSMRSLTYLRLDMASFGGHIPPQLGNLSNLHSLSLGGQNFFSDESPAPQLFVENLNWLSGLSSLEDLVMDDVDLHSAVDWLESINMLSSLSMLTMESCDLDNMDPSLESVNFSSLTTLALPGNNFNHEMPHWIFKLPRLISLILGNNQLRGQIPEYLGQLKHLEALALDSNSLDGPIPFSIGNLSSLRLLYLSGNRLNGTLPSSLWLLSNLEYLLVDNNSFVGTTISEVHFRKLSKLGYLDISHLPSLVFKVDPNWVPPFQLKYMGMGSCQMGPDFPMWLQTQTSLWYLDISNSSIVDSAPTWFWKWASTIDTLIDLSNNQIYGNLSEVLLNNTYIDLSSNCFEGELPRLSSNVVIFKMANNSFSGSISHFLCRKQNEDSQLEILDMSTNRLSGEISDCWKYWRSLTHLNLGNNYLSSKILDSMASLFKLEALHLHNNSLFGNIPPSFRNCTSLVLLDLGSNKFSGDIPSWLGEMTTLTVLKLRSNGLTGSIPPQICKLSSLIVLDFAENNLSGTIPRCFNNFTLMTTINTKYDTFTALDYYRYGQSYESVLLVIKGRESEYKSILKLIRIIDLSRNNFFGSIPEEISSLFILQSLNLSFNHLTGSIPEKIGSMTYLECLDLSRNHLSGEIPQSIKTLTFLNHLDVSYNNFSGRIPLSTQLQSFGALNYIGNTALCGAPLANNCMEDEEPKGTNTIDINEEDSKRSWFNVGTTIGFILGFWGVCGSLILKRSWRYAYFQFVSYITDWLYVAIMIKWKRLRNILRENMED